MCVRRLTFERSAFRRASQMGAKTLLQLEPLPKTGAFGNAVVGVLSDFLAFERMDSAWVLLERTDVLCEAFLHLFAAEQTCESRFRLEVRQERRSEEASRVVVGRD